MIVIDTSVWISVLRDRTKAEWLREILKEEPVALTRFHQLELLQGARDEQEWARLSEYLSAQDYLEMRPTTWAQAARMCFDLRRLGKTIRSPIDCCIAQLTLENGGHLLHNDRDFETIEQVRPLANTRVEFDR